MRSSRVLAVPAAAAALVVGAAAPALAQYPGVNGAVIADQDAGGWSGLSCLHPADPNDPVGYFLPIGEGAVAPDKTREVGWADGGLVTAARTSSGTCSPAAVVPFEHDATNHSGLSFSPDSKELAVDVAGDVLVVDPATGRTLRNLTPNLPTTRESDPSWDPKGRAIAYVASDGIRTRPPQGGASKLLVKGKVSSPDYSPDGRYLGYVDAGGHIAYADAVTGALVRTTPISAPQGRFSYSPDGTQVAFTNVDLQCVTATLTGRITGRFGSETYCAVDGWAAR